MSPTKQQVASAAGTLCESGWALTLFHTYYDDARQNGLPPHHSISFALGKLSKLEPPMPGSEAVAKSQVDQEGDATFFAANGKDLDQELRDSNRALGITLLCTLAMSGLAAWVLTAY